MTRIVFYEIVAPNWSRDKKRVFDEDQEDANDVQVMETFFT